MSIGFFFIKVSSIFWRILISNAAQAVYCYTVYRLLFFHKGILKKEV